MCNYFDPHKPSVALHVTSHLICFINQMTGFYLSEMQHWTEMDYPFERFKIKTYSSFPSRHTFSYCTQRHFINSLTTNVPHHIETSQMICIAYDGEHQSFIGLKAAYFQFEPMQRKFLKKHFFEQVSLYFNQILKNKRKNQTVTKID